MLEIELKFAHADFASLEQILPGWGAHEEPPLDEADHYFNAPDRDFGRTDEAFRLRRIGAANRVTYKGPRLAGVGKVRTEIEVPLADGAAVAEDFARLLVCLGYRPVAVVRKRRRIFRLQREGYTLEVCLDDVEGLGRFAEVEILAPETELEKARDVLLRIATALGLTASERRSYLELLLTRKREGSP